MTKPIFWLSPSGLHFGEDFVAELSPQHHEMLAEFILAAERLMEEKVASKEYFDAWADEVKKNVALQKRVEELELEQDGKRLETIQDHGADNDIYAEPEGNWSIRERSGERTVFQTLQECADALAARAQKGEQ